MLSQYIRIRATRAVAVGLKNRYFITFFLKISDKVNIKLDFCDIAILVKHCELFILHFYLPHIAIAYSMGQITSSSAMAERPREA